jgi:TM2 domain-containing membrane protein YozV
MAVPTVAGAPNPGVAAFLGFIPGVGAMYNGQFAKAFIHVMIFVLSIVATANLSDWFGFAIPFSILYMVFDAYKTAQAKQFGLPAPDILGIDKLFGLQESQPAPGVTTPSPAVPGGTITGGTTAAPATSANAVTGAVPPAAPASPQDAFAGAPTGAIVLIVLGTFFLFSNFYSIHMRNFWPLFLIGLGLWIAYKRTMQKG